MERSTRTRPAPRRLAGAAVALAALAAAACTDGGPPASPGGGGVQALRSGAPVTLLADRDCDAVLGDLQRFAPEVLEADLGGFVQVGARLFGPDVAMEEMAGDTADDMAVGAPMPGAAPATDATSGVGESTGSGAAADGGTSETNVQEAGIDEPDVVETDGEHVYLVDGETLVVLDAATAEVVSRTGLGAWGAQLLLQGERLLVVASGGMAYAESSDGRGIVDGVDLPAIEPDVAEPLPVDEEPPPVDAGLVDPAEPVSEPRPDEPRPRQVEPEPLPVPVEPLPGPVEPPEGFFPGTVLRLLDVSDPAAPRVVQTAEVEGDHVSTRVVDGVARVVVRSWPQHGILDGPAPAALDDVVERFGDDVLDEDDVAEIRGTVREVLTERAAETTVEDWLPAVRTTTVPEAGPATTVEEPLVPCESVLVPEVNAGLAETSVLRVDFADGFDPADTTTVVADAQSIYASPTTLYLSATRWQAVPVDVGAASSQIAPVPAGQVDTAIQAFDLRGDGPAAHVGAGEVPGSLLNQYSMSEHGGHLRVATTEEATGTSASQSGVRVLRLEPGSAGAPGRLVEVGAVTGLGETETIQSVRFMGDVGYVVTFRQTDPLYVIDLSDPADPRALGELKIPGFSSYLHPVGEGRLVGIGRDADLEGRDQGLLVSLFDVSDPTAPAQLQTHVERDAWSAAGWDPKAFLWWAPESALAIPIERYGTDVGGEDVGGEDVGGYEVGITVLDVADDGIAVRGTVTQDGRYASRALVVQGRLWSLFDGGVAVSELADPAAASWHPVR